MSILYLTSTRLKQSCQTVQMYRLVIAFVMFTYNTNISCDKKMYNEYDNVRGNITTE